MSEQSVEWVKGVYDAFAQGDIPTVLGAFADDVEWFEAEGMPYGGLYRSGEAVLQNVFGPIAEDVEGFAVTPEEYIASGATVSGRFATASWCASGSSSTRSSSQRSCPRSEPAYRHGPAAAGSRHTADPTTPHRSGASRSDGATRPLSSASTTSPAARVFCEQMDFEGAGRRWT